MHQRRSWGIFDARGERAATSGSGTRSDFRSRRIGDARRRQSGLAFQRTSDGRFPTSALRSPSAGEQFRSTMRMTSPRV